MLSAKDTLRYLVQDSLTNFTQMVVDACHSTVDCEEGMEWGSDVVNSPFKYGQPYFICFHQCPSAVQRCVLSEVMQVVLYNYIGLHGS